MSPRSPALRRQTAAVAALSLLVLLVASTPHRVHHLFDSKAAKSCAVYTLASGCDAAVASLGFSAAAPDVADALVPADDPLLLLASPAPHFGRAPPTR